MSVQVVSGKTAQTCILARDILALSVKPGGKKHINTKLIHGCVDIYIRMIAIIYINGSTYGLFTKKVLTTATGTKSI